MKKYLFLIFTLCCFAFVGCLKDLDSEGVSQGTVLKGCVVESGSDAAIAGMKVLITNGDRQGEENRTATNGSFELTITHEQLHEGYYLLLTADSLYRTTTIHLPNLGIGLKEYDLQTITVDGPELPSVQTDAISGISQTSAVGGGTIADDGRSAVRRRGICYSTTSVQPTVNDAHTQDGTGTGSYTSTVIGLQSGTTYYIRAYATNALGTGFGEVKTVTTF